MLLDTFRWLGLWLSSTQEISIFIKNASFCNKNTYKQNYEMFSNALKFNKPIQETQALNWSLITNILMLLFLFTILSKCIKKRKELRFTTCI